MVLKLYSASAPGSLMLFGEHAVLRGKPALVCAIDKRVTVELTVRSDDAVILDSKIYGKLQLDLGDFKADKIIREYPSWRFVLAVIIANKRKIKSGFHLKITSDFPSQPIGLGSSAAVTAASYAALAGWLNKKPLDPALLLRAARSVILSIQGVGSGADLAASIFGGIVYYKMRPLFVQRLTGKIPLTVVSSGSKTPTAEVIKKVSELEKKHKKVFAEIFSAMSACVSQARGAILSRDWRRLGELMNLHQGLQDALGVNDEALSKLIFALRSEPNIFGAKISGSGLGDCVIGLGNTKQDFDAKKISIDLSQVGIKTTRKTKMRRI